MLMPVCFCSSRNRIEINWIKIRLRWWWLWCLYCDAISMHRFEFRSHWTSNNQCLFDTPLFHRWMPYHNCRRFRISDEIESSSNTNASSWSLCITMWILYTRHGYVTLWHRHIKERYVTDIGRYRRRIWWESMPMYWLSSYSRCWKNIRWWYWSTSSTCIFDHCSCRSNFISWSIAFLSIALHSYQRFVIVRCCQEKKKKKKSID